MKANSHTRALKNHLITVLWGTKCRRSEGDFISELQETSKQFVFQLSVMLIPLLTSTASKADETDGVMRVWTKQYTLKFDSVHKKHISWKHLKLKLVFKQLIIKIVWWMEIKYRENTFFSFFFLVKHCSWLCLLNKFRWDLAWSLGGDLKRSLPVSNNCSNS